MTAIRRYETPSSAQLLRHVLERPDLVSAVRDLPGETLARLIERVGLEDAGEIVALASTEQLAQVFDQDLWQAAHVGGDEDFQPRRFGLWLHVLAEAGDDFVAERLAALPKELLLLALHRLVLVLDMDALAEQLGQSDEDLDQTEKALETSLYEEWEEFRLIARDHECWDVLWSALVTLDRDHHGLLRDLLSRCAALDVEYIEDNGGLYEVLTSEEMLESDLAAERADRRASAGHVAPSDARAFLGLARVEGAPLQRDPITRAYFRQLSPQPVAPAQQRAPSRALHELTQLLGESASPSARTPALSAGRAQSTKRSGADRSGQDLAQRSAAPQHTLLERALIELREHDPVLASTRLEELAYLANVWIAGGSHEGRKPRPLEALEFVSSECDRALEQLSREPPPNQATSVPSALQSASPAAQVLASTECDLLFRHAYGARDKTRRDA